MQTAFVILVAVVLGAEAQQGGSFIGSNDYSFSYGSSDGAHKIRASLFNGKWEVRGSMVWTGNDGITHTTNFLVDQQGVRSGVTDNGLVTIPRPSPGSFGGGFPGGTGGTGGGHGGFSGGGHGGSTPPSGASPGKVSIPPSSPALEFR